MNMRFPTNQHSRRSLPIQLLSAALLLTSLIALSATGQAPNQGADNSKSDAKTANAIVGEFKGNNLSIKIQTAANGYAGRIVKGAQSFTFTGLLKGNILNGVIDLSGKKSPFSASITGDTLALSMELDTFKLVRTNTSPQPTGFAGRFGEAKFSVTLNESAKANQFTGTLVRGEKTFNLTAKKEDQTLSGTIDLGSAKPPFTATLKGNALVLTMGLDSHTLPRMKGTTPRPTPRDAGPFTGIYVGKDCLMRFHVVNGEIWGQLETGANTRDFSGTIDGQTFYGVIEVDKSGSRFTAVHNNGNIALKLASTTLNLKKLARNTTRRSIVLAEDISKALTNSLTFSPDNRRVAHFQTIVGKQHLFVNGKQGPGHFRTATLRFSPNSQRLSYMIKKGNAYHLVIDGKESEPYEKAFMPLPMFSPDSQRTAYQAGRGKETWVVVDGQADKHYDFVTGTRFSPDSKRIAYVGYVNKRPHVIVDRKDDPEFDAILRNQIFFSPDSQRVAYVAARELKERAIIDGSEGNPFDAITQLDFSPNSKHVAYIGYVGNRMHAVIDGKKGPAFELVEQLTFSPDSSQLGYRAKQGDNWLLIVNGKTKATSEGLGEFAFNPADQSLAYIARRDDKWIVVLDGKIQPAFKAIRGFQFSRNGQHWGYIGKRDGHWRVVVDHKSSPRYQGIMTPNITFSPSGKHHAYVGKSNGEMFVVVDGVNDQSLGALKRGSDLVFESDTLLSTSLESGKGVIRLEIHIDK